jgi:hypothetical protein
MELKVAAATYKKMASESCEVTMAAGMKCKSAISSLPFSGGNTKIIQIPPPPIPQLPFQQRWRFHAGNT